MNYGFKPTTHGEALIAACMDLGAPLKITRAAVGSGLAGGSLADTHALVHYIAEASIGERRHEGNQLFLSVQYRNDAHPEQEDFVLAEFIVYAQDPETEQETDFLYATLGDNRQPVPSFKSGFPASVWTFPVVLTVSGDLKVEITASPGLITTIDLQDAIDALKLEIMTNELTLPLATDAGDPLLTSSGTPLLAVYHPDSRAAVLAELAALEGRMEAADAAVRAYAAGRALELTSKINTAKTEAIAAASEDAAGQDKVVEKRLIYRIANDFNKHNSAGSAHPGTLAVSGLTPPLIQLPVPEDAQDILDDYIDILNLNKN